MHMSAVKISFFYDFTLFQTDTKAISKTVFSNIQNSKNDFILAGSHHLAFYLIFGSVQ